MRKLIASLVGLSLVMTLAGCIGGPRDEKTAFVNAIVESACTIFEPGGTADLYSQELNAEVEAIFDKYGFEVTDQDALDELSEKYVGDKDVQMEIAAGIQECVTDMPEFEGLVDAMEEIEELEIELEAEADLDDLDEDAEEVVEETEDDVEDTEEVVEEETSE